MGCAEKFLRTSIALGDRSLAGKTGRLKKEKKERKEKKKEKKEKQAREGLCHLLLPLLTIGASLEGIPAVGVAEQPGTTSNQAISSSLDASRLVEVAEQQPDAIGAEEKLVGVVGKVAKLRVIQEDSNHRVLAIGIGKENLVKLRIGGCEGEVGVQNFSINTLLLELKESVLELRIEWLHKDEVKC
uniref:Uncharacterized protein n=1 Tax=Ananas comosus var. bracteatus TaxID=296719 RepID=A0A6V7NSL6_ANACO|nr:unnamed protein product [Ananas comosus var. bracteatus]